jgi:hypothetical protein
MQVVPFCMASCAWLLSTCPKLASLIVGSKLGTLDKHTNQRCTCGLLTSSRQLVACDISIYHHQLVASLVKSPYLMSYHQKKIFSKR